VRTDACDDEFISHPGGDLADLIQRHGIQTLDHLVGVAAGVADELVIACVGPHTVQEFESA
jgi:hypothetical protein